MTNAERKIMGIVNKTMKYNLSGSNFQYAAFDAHSDKYIAEIKDRRTNYETTMVEFKKYAFNTLFGQLNNRKFIYIVRSVDDKIYLFNMDKLTKEDYPYNWKWQGNLPKTTDFEDNDKTWKYVGYISFKHAEDTINMGEMKL